MQDVARIAETWPALSDADRSRLLQAMTTEEKQALRLAIKDFTRVQFPRRHLTSDQSPCPDEVKINFLDS